IKTSAKSGLNVESAFKSLINFVIKRDNSTSVMERKKILIICTHNSARSQMAEGLINTLYNDKFEAYSAGTEVSEVRQQAVKVMKEIGIDISHHYSKHMKDFYGTKFDLAITVCDNAKKICPVFPGAKQNLHKAFPDPSAIKGTEEEKLTGFRKVRDQIHQWIKEELIPSLNNI
ncbi:MAG: arsenate reductase ArsC, partial [Candidatus Thorarchaeota archaeon]